MLLPAVDVRAGRAVQMVQGVVGTEREFGDALAAALRWQDEGASWIHLVDLDAAFDRGSNHDLLAEIVGRLDIAVELSSGVRDDESLAAALATGCRRVVLAAGSLGNRAWCERVVAEHGDRVLVGLDVRGRTLAPRGATNDGTSNGADVFDTIGWLDAVGCARYVVTDVARDGMLQGPNLDLLRAVTAATDRPVVASGGIGELPDLLALRALVPHGIEGAIVGTALHEGRFTLREALDAARRG